MVIAQSLDGGDSIVVPLARVDDLMRVGGIAGRFASALDRSIDVLMVIDPEDDFDLESGRLTHAVDELAAALDRPVGHRVVAHESPREVVVDACRDRLVCMATAATPFDDRHYVGSFAAAVLSESRSPVILVGPLASPDCTHTDKVVVAVSDAVDGRAALVTGQSLALALDAPLAKIVIDPKGVVYETDYHDPAVGFPDEVHAGMALGSLDDDQICAELVARSENGILVLATRARQGLSWIAEGSIAFDTIGMTRGPVVALGPHAFETD